MLKMSREKDTAKKSRSSNFGKAEIELLCNLLLKYSKVIESKKSDAFTWKEKVEIWNKLTSEFNSKNNGFPRTMISLKSKYETMKKEVRKKIANNKQELYKTGGGTAKPNPLTPVEEIIYNLIYLSAVGLSARYDDDNPSDIQQSSASKNIKIIEVGEYEDDESDVQDETIYVEFQDDYLAPVMDESEYCPNESLSREVTTPILAPIVLLESIQSDLTEDLTPSQTSAERKVKYKTSTPIDATRPIQNQDSQQENEVPLLQKWTPKLLKKPLSKELQVRKQRNLLTKLQAAEKVSTLAEAKKELLELQTKYLMKEMEFQEQEHELKLKKAQEEYKNIQLEGNIKELERRIKEETLKKILSNTLNFS